MTTQSLLQYLPLVVIIVAFYFILIRPQQRKQKERNSMMKSLGSGDKVVTIGGVHGTIVEMDEQTVTLRVSDNTRMTFERSAISSIKEKS